MESIDLVQTLLAVLLTAALITGLTWIAYWGPRARAFRTGERRVPVWFRAGTLVLWNPGETFVFLKNKKLIGVGDEHGGMRTTFWMRGDEAIGPIPLRTDMLDWEDRQVLTREAQPLAIKVAVWWKIGDPQTYAFSIYDDATQQAQLQSAGHGRLLDQVAIRTTVKRWIEVLTESAVRSQINQLSVADVVSAQATQFLQEIGETGRSPHPSQLGVVFEGAMAQGLKTIQEKAKRYGIQIDRLEVQHVHLPEDIQQAINDTRKAFLAPIKTEREAEAAKIQLEKLAQVLGKDTVGLNELMKNLKGAQFVTPFNFMQPLFAAIDQRASSATAATKQLPLEEATNGEGKGLQKAG